MNHMMHRDMLEATRLTRAGQLAEASALLQRALRGETTLKSAPGFTGDSGGAPVRHTTRVNDVVPETIEATYAQPSACLVPAFPNGSSCRTADLAEGRAALAVPGALSSILARNNRTGSTPGMAEWARRSPTHAPAVVPDGGQFVTRSFSNGVGRRAYKLYVPSGYHGQTLPLIVMLHGCTQSPDDFATGTRMNTLAEEHTCLVAYPAQAASANVSRCWNWFSPGDQQRDQGEPSLIAGITFQVMRDYSIDPRRVYVAGLSAGGAAAAIMGAAYPDLYAAVGVHSGLACGAARDVPTAFAAMRQGNVGVVDRSRGVSETEKAGRIVPTIVFHGDQDSTVHPRNGDHVIAQASAISTAGSTAGLQKQVKQGRKPGGHPYSRTSFADPSGAAILEQWVIHGAGHAWSGGSPAGSYTDPRGPDAAREMLRFFLEHPHPEIAQ
jgi:poly(hydroxyalkanoate) depolymerase family esterase